MRTSNDSALFALVAADCDDIKMAESHIPATQGDLRCLYINLQKWLRQVNSELLAEQKKQLERSIEFVMCNASGCGNDACIPDVSVCRSQPRAPPWSPERIYSQASRDVWDLEEKHDACPQQASEQEKGRVTVTSGTASSIAEETRIESVASKGIRNASVVTHEDTMDSSASSRFVEPSRVANSRGGPRPSMFVADKIEKHSHIDARDQNGKVTRHRTLSSSSVNPISQIGSSFAKSISSPVFDAICGLIICFNAILIGIETECLAQNGKVPNSIEILQVLLNTWYTAELFLRIYANRCNFFCGEDRNWNIFDILLVASALVDIALANMAHGIHLKARILRAVRLFRIVRTIRIIRTLKYVREFRKMAYSLMSSFNTLLWSVLLVLGFMYAFALWFTQAAAWYKSQHGATHDARILANINAFNMYYSSVARTIYTLFAAISGGYSWSVVADPWISTAYWETAVPFFVYISVVVFGMMNIVTSVFVESAMHATRHFQDLLVDAKEKDLEMYTYHMERIFREIDKDKGGTISFKEMQKFLESSDSELPQYFEALGISAANVWVLFRLLDQDGSGNIDIGEFCDGCMRLKGEAKSFDINCMIFENRAMTKHHASFMEFVEDKLVSIGLQLEQKTLELGRRVSMGHCAMMSKFEKIDRRFTNRVSDNSEASLTQLRYTPRTPLTETLGALTPPVDPVTGPMLVGMGSRKGVSRRERTMYSTLREAATSQPKSFTDRSSIDELAS